MSPSPSAAIVADEKPPTLPGLSAGVPHPCSGGGRKRYSSPTCSPSSRSAFRLATLVWELTWSGGAPGLTTASKPTPPAVLAPTTPAAEAEAETPSTPGLEGGGGGSRDALDPGAGRGRGRVPAQHADALGRASEDAGARAVVHPSNPGRVGRRRSGAHLPQQAERSVRRRVVQGDQLAVAVHGSRDRGGGVDGVRQ